MSSTVKATETEQKELYDIARTIPCEKNSIKFYDTSFERDNVLEDAMRYLIN